MVLTSTPPRRSRRSGSIATRATRSNTPAFIPLGTRHRSLVLPGGSVARAADHLRQQGFFVPT
ncbi:MAG: hypothetical protein IPL99_28180 [Candidatus Competibacteraceae bacterium]|nr:hypothetical protein [Candidatus Competibacteraceae bacterium]